MNSCINMMMMLYTKYMRSRQFPLKTISIEASDFTLNRMREFPRTVEKKPSILKVLNLFIGLLLLLLLCQSAIFSDCDLHIHGDRKGDNSMYVHFWFVALLKLGFKHLSLSELIQSTKSMLKAN